MDEQIKAKIERFAGTVRRFCAWAETPFTEPETEMQTARMFLAELHLAVLGLPDVEPEDDIEFEDETSEKWESVCKRFNNFPINGYWIVFDPIEAQENDTVYATLFDDFTDIYRDLERGLQLYEAGHFAEAAWDWNFNFKIHWGQHLLEAQRVLHWWLYHNQEL